MRQYLERREKEAFFKRLENIEEASPEESAEILAMIDGLTDDDREVVRVDYITC